MAAMRACFAALILLGLGGAAAAQETDFYQGKTITIPVGSSAGGGYDLYARLIARHLGKHLAGHPAIVVTNMPGAASNALAAHIANVAPKDGTIIGAIFMGAVVEPLFGHKTRATHDPSKLQYIGNANKDFYVCLVRADAGVQSLADAFDKELVMGGTAEGASTRDFAVLLKNLLGVKFKVVTGYTGSRQINLALERGEIQGGCGQSWSSVAATYPSWFSEGKVKVLVQEDTEGYPDLNRQGVPLVRSFARTEEEKQILDLIYSQTAFGRPYVVAPEVPKERVALLRQAFMATMQDPELRAEAERMQVDVIPIAGEALQDRIASLYATPKELLDKVRAALAGK
jgi:tripartite-type tricarboxylate transporter receptor subunit TctC